VGNGDGLADLVWRHTIIGQTGVWLMNGFTPVITQLISGPIDAWQIAAVADLDGDGKADLVWRNPSTGENGMWLMNGFAIASAQSLPPVAVPWQIHLRVQQTMDVRLVENRDRREVFPPYRRRPVTNQAPRAL
jgi:hypothetical protein